MMAQKQVPDATNQSSSRQWTCLETALDEESTEADDLGAFASLLSDSASEVDTKSPETNITASLSLEHALPEEVEIPNNLDLDSEKNIMVCRHWKTKGWCRLEANCKFLHPEHKRGIAAPKPCCGSGMSRAMSPGISTGDSEMPAAALARHRRRGGKNRPNKGVPSDVQDCGVFQLPAYAVEPNLITFHCMSFV
jgi:hypothetical protein